MTSLTIEERVAKGAEFLDEAEPGWYRIIDIQQIDMKGDCECVLGQIVKEKTGDEDLGFSEAVLNDENDPRIQNVCMSAREAYERGFHVSKDLTWETENPEWDELANEWKRIVMERRVGEIKL